MSVAVALIASMLLAHLVYKWMKFARKKAEFDKIHGPRSYPIVGNVHQIKRDPAELIEQAMGATFMWHTPRMFRVWLGHIPILNICGAEEAEVVLSSNKHITKADEYKFLRPWLGLGLLTNLPEQWRPRRKLFTPTFHYDILKDFVDVFNNEAQILVQKIADATNCDPVLDVYQYITLCALDIICETAMGQHVNAQHNANSDYVRALKTISEIILFRQKQPWFWPDWTFRNFGRGREHDRCLAILHSFTEKLIQQRIVERRQAAEKCGEKIPDDGVLPEKEVMIGYPAGVKRRLAFLDLALDMADAGKLSYHDVREEVDTFMFEGHDTTAAGMNWALFLLGCYPAIQAKVHDELDRIFGDDGRKITSEDLKQLVYLECVLKESLRLYPSVPFYGRELLEDMEIADFKIPRGARIVVYPYIIHRDPRHWPDAEVFNPDRFLPENCEGRHPYAFVPFSAGPRNCIGQRFALMEEKTVLAWVLRYFKVTSVLRRDQVNVQAKLILIGDKGTKLIVEQRRQISFAASN